LSVTVGPFQRPCGQVVVNGGTSAISGQVRAVRGALLKTAVGLNPHESLALRSVIETAAQDELLRSRQLGVTLVTTQIPVGPGRTGCTSLTMTV